MMRQPEEREAEDFIANAEFIWYQQFDLFPGVTTPGVNPIGSILQAFDFPRDLSGKSVLDIGTTNGAVAFEAERRGASRVVAVDIRDVDWFGFRALRDFFESTAEFAQCSVYELADVVGETFDFVVFLGVLYHLRHPLLGLDAVRRLARDVVFLETAVADYRDDPTDLTARFNRLDDLEQDGSNWWSPTSAALDAWCRSAGFEVDRMQTMPAGKPATRCLSTLRVADGTPEYLRVSYERPLIVSTREYEPAVSTP